jgi:hypothetical protein
VKDEDETLVFCRCKRRGDKGAERGKYHHNRTPMRAGRRGGGRRKGGRARRREGGREGGGREGGPTRRVTGGPLWRRRRNSAAHLLFSTMRL